mgnify:CR=1 FL=1
MSWPTPELAAQVNSLPQKPGVYVFRDAQGSVLYVGKAVNLRHRVRSYFQNARHLTAKTLLMLNQLAAVEHIVTDNEVEALILENNLIKQYRPKYNVRLRDDKQYPYIKITREPWPRVLVVRETEKDGARYFGPYTNAGAMRDTLQTLRKVFPYRTCSNRRLRRGGRPCLYYYIGRCLGPCDARCTPAEYQKMIDELADVLAGRGAAVARRLEQAMHRAADQLAFEQAAVYRDKLQALEAVLAEQKMVTARFEDHDVVALARQGDEASVVVFFVREGKLVGRDHLMLAGAADLPDAEVMACFLQQYYSEAAFIPRDLLLQVEPTGRETLADWLSTVRGKRCYLHVPRRGEKRRLVELAAANARELLTAEARRRERLYRRSEEAVAELQAYLQLPEPPQRIECYDISNFQGRDTVGSMVVFVGGRPKKSAYRRFRLRTVEGPDDFASLQEVLYRRFKRGLAERQELAARGHLDEEEARFAEFPDLIIIDGGKGQLNAALEVLRTLNLDHLPVFALAKGAEELFAPDQAEPLVLPRDSRALHLLQRLRDEAHRFAVAYHRRLRRKHSLKSVLDDIPGIGEKRKTALLKHFGSVESMRRASVEELAAVPGMTRTAAEQVAAWLADDQAGKN